MRTLILLSLLCTAAPLQAQGFVAGYVVDSATRAPLHCIDVALQDTAGRIVARQTTESDGAFLLSAPARGEYRLRFSTWGQEPLYGPLETIDSTTRREGTFALSLVDFVGQLKLRESDTVANAPPGRPLNLRTANIRYPAELYRKKVQGEVRADFVVDSTGSVVPESIRIVSSTHPDFSDAVVKHLRALRLEPAVRDHRPVCALMHGWPFRFRLDG
jgi:TonB family protein